MRRSILAATVAPDIPGVANAANELLKYRARCSQAASIDQPTFSACDWSVNRLPVDDLALLTYATPRAPDDALAAPLHAAGITVIAAGDARAPQEMLFAAASGHAAGEAA
jgi:hypothetical protein